MIKEFCSENHEQVGRALDLGANRIELCDNMAVGGTTPSYGVIAHVCHQAHEQGVSVMTMIRPRGGDFCYDQAELDIMRLDIQQARVLGSDGLVFGLLTQENWLDQPALETLLEVAGDCQTVFHMAFDQIPRSRQFEALEVLIELGVTRVLTRGGVAGSALNHIDWLQQLITYADGRIEILVGGGLTEDNYTSLVQTLGINQVHGTRLFW